MRQKGITFLAFLLLMGFCVVLAVPAQTPEEFYTRGMNAARRGAYPQALQDLRRAVDGHPEFAKAHAGLGTIYLHLGKFDAAEAAFKAALAITPGLLQAEANLAALYTKTGRAEAAIRLYETLIPRQPNSVQIWIGLGTAYQQAEHFDAAINAYQESLKRDPSLVGAMANLASCYEAIDAEERAIHYYKAALTLEPKLPMANGNLGAIYQKQGELEKALPLLETAVRENPEFTAARYCLGLVLTKKRDYPRAAAEYQRVIAQQRDHIGAYYNLAQAFFRLKRREDGKRAMEIYQQLQAIAEEIDTRERATLAEPTNPLKQHQLGHVYAKYGKTEKAIAAFQAAVSLDPEAHYALNALARLYTLQGIHLQDAIAAAEKAFRLAEKPQYLQTLAVAHFQAGDLENALKAIRAAIEKDPENGAFRYTLGKIEAAAEKMR